MMSHGRRGPSKQGQGSPPACLLCLMFGLQFQSNSSLQVWAHVFLMAHWL